MFKLSALPLELGNARLRTLEPRDAAAFAAGTEDEEVKKFAHLPQPHYTPESVLAMISGDVTEGLSIGTLAVLALADRVTDEFAGSLVIFDVSPQNDTASTRASAELGFWISARHRGRGLAGDGIELGTQFARACGIDVLRARTVPENEASLRALTGRGFAENGTARSTAPSSEVLDLVSLERTLVPPPSLPLKTGRLTLRKHRSSDAGWLSDVYGDDAFARYLLHEPWSLEDTQRELRIRMDQTDLDGSARAIALVIEHEGTPVGDVSLTYTDPARRVVEIGWAICAERRRTWLRSRSRPCDARARIRALPGAPRRGADGRAKHRLGRARTADWNAPGGPPPPGLVEQGRMDRHPCLRPLSNRWINDGGGAAPPGEPHLRRHK